MLDRCPAGRVFFNSMNSRDRPAAVSCSRHMSLRITVAVLLLIAAVSSRAEPVGGLPLYVHVFVCPAQVMITSAVRLEHDIDVRRDGAPDYLSGRVMRREGKLHANLTARIGSRSVDFDGELEVDCPAYATSASTHSGIVIIPSFLVSHRLDVSELIQKQCSQ